MKRSEINDLLTVAKDLAHANKIVLPPFAYWSPEDWATKGSECDEIRDCALGWDITDFGTGKFDEVGLILFTIRNGDKDDPRYKHKTYSEKLLIAQENQITPYHFHWFKVEDIINKAGGNLMLRLYNSTEDEKLDESSDVTVVMDGVSKTLPAGSTVTLTAGESITLPAYLYHEFWAEEGTGAAVIGEVSKVNDDNTDNCFLDELGRFSEIEEDTAPLHYLCNEYPS